MFGHQAHQRFRLMGVELIDDKDPVAFGIYRKGVFNVISSLFLCGSCQVLDE